ncbi:MAG: helix-turn-helix domain-containing protein [Actinomycetota bacterium]
MSARAATAVPGTRDRIVETALRLFSERGTSAVSVREVADAAGVTVPGLYYHFAAKADLIRAVYQANGVRPGWDPEADFVPPTACAVADRIAQQARHEFARMVGNEEFLRHMQREDTLGDDDARAVGDSLLDAWRERWCEVLRGSADLAPDADVEAAADATATFLWGLFVLYLSRRDLGLADRIEPYARLMGAALVRPTG